MEVRYVPSRADVKALLSYNLRHSRRLQLTVAGIALMPAAIVAILDGLQGKVTVGAIVPALVFGCGLAAFLLVRAVRRTKEDERWLSIAPEGIRTTIGSMKGEVSWAKVDRAVCTPEYIFISGRSMNGFAIPLRAFDPPAERDEFLRDIERYTNGKLVFADAA